jgi:mannosyl-3-phosphoglycerate phosphatase
MTAKIMRPVFITDLDGTLLGHDDFSFTPIRDDFLNLLDRGVQIIFNSSKTSTEIRAFCDDLGVKLPFICENGAALFNADLLVGDMLLGDTAPSTMVLGTTVEGLMAAWDEAIDPALRRHCILLDAMGPKAQQHVLGLAGQQLSRALDRDFSVLFSFYGSHEAFADLCSQAAFEGLCVHSGGRVHCLSGQHDKSSFNKMIRQRCSAPASKAAIIGFGDSQNDIALLSQADVACVIPRPRQPVLQLADPPPKVITVSQPAPSGWVIAASQALTLLEKNNRQGGHDG